MRYVHGTKVRTKNELRYGLCGDDGYPENIIPAGTEGRVETYDPDWHYVEGIGPAFKKNP